MRLHITHVMRFLIYAPWTIGASTASMSLCMHSVSKVLGNDLPKGTQLALGFTITWQADTEECSQRDMLAVLHCCTRPSDPCCAPIMRYIESSLPLVWNGYGIYYYFQLCLFLA